MSNRPFPAMLEAFPHFDQSTLPPIPLAWVDLSWRGARFSDACPQFSATPDALAGTGVRVIINFEDQCGCGDSYVVCLFDCGEECVEEWGGDDWAEALAHVAKFKEKWATLRAANVAESEAEDSKPCPALENFPDYPPADLPRLPEGWIDESWRNDACPCYVAPDGFAVWIDYPAPDQRELPDSKRFCVYNHVAVSNSADNGESWEFDTWAEVLAWIQEGRDSLPPSVAKGFGDSRDEAVTWIREMHKHGLAFHWEDSAYEIIGGKVAANLFHPAAAVIVEACRIRLYDFKWPEDSCPCGVSLAIMTDETLADMSEGYREKLAAFDLPQMSADDLWHEIVAVMSGESSAFITPQRVAAQGLDKARDYVRQFWTEWDEVEARRANYLRLFPTLRG